MKRKKTSYADDLCERLKDPEYAAEYLNAVLNDDDDELDAAFLLALRNVAEAFQMSNVAQKADLNRENLYRMLSGRGNPRLSSLFAILRVLGLKFSIEHIQSNRPVAGKADFTYVEVELHPHPPMYSGSEVFRQRVESNRHPGRIEIRTKYNPVREEVITPSNPTFAYSA